MTHTLHRRGLPEDLAGDFVFLATSAKGINVPGTPEVMRRFYEIVLRHNPTFVGDGARGNQLTLGIGNLMAEGNDRTTPHAVFRDAETVAAVIKDLVDAGFDRSVVVSGLFDEVKECCRKAGLGVPHTLEFSLGSWGKTEKMASGEELEVMTMCGHAQIPASLVRHLALQVRAGRLTAEEAADKMARQCPCGIFNVGRAAELVTAIAARE